MSIFSIDDLSGYQEGIKLREKQLEATYLALKKFKLLLVKSPEELNIADVKNALIERGVPESDLEHLRNDIVDRLEVHYKNKHLELSKSLFPRRDLDKGFRFNVMSYPIAEIIQPFFTADSISVYILSVIDWLHEYDNIEVQLKQELEQERIACAISIDLLKRVAETILSKKGYEYSVTKDRSSNKGCLRITVDGDFTMDFKVNLLENFVDKLTRLLEALPDNQPEPISLLTLTNILHCTVIEDFSLELIGRLERGGNNVIAHRGKLWIPNISECIKKDCKNAKIYTKDDLLPPTAPIAELKAYNGRMEEYMKGYTEAERNDFLERIVNGVGFAGHYNRHRYKMPEDKLCTQAHESRQEK